MIRRSRPLTALLAATAACSAAPPSPSAAPPAPAHVAAAPAPAPRVQPGRATLTFSGELTQGGWIRGTVPAGTIALALDGTAVPFATDGRFFIAFDRDAGPTATLVVRRGGVADEVRTLAIRPRAWQIENVDAPYRPPSLPGVDFQRIRAGELARINAARALRSDAQGWRQDFIWPARGRISGRFGAQRVYQGKPGSYHSGLDIAGPSGAAYVAPADGVVILAAQAPFTLEGNLLMIDHGGGLSSAFLHSSQLLVREGETVRQGQAIGRIGSTGRATGPHLHWSLKWRDARLDPLLFVDGGG